MESFVRYGKILDVRLYKGDWKVHYNPSIIENAIKDYVNAPMRMVLISELLQKVRHYWLR